LAKAIKSRRAPLWPSPPTTDLPSKNVADELVDCYLRTTETVLRILHIPTFRRDYEALWVSDVEPKRAFIVQLKLVLALGATTYDEQFSLRAAAIRWVYEAQTWLSEPNFKSRLCMRTLQTNLLLLLARETVGVGGDSIWISAGALFRRAVHMGLHRDPARLPKRTSFDAEMRRRLWNTILELNLQSSLTVGAPPFVSLDDFDTEPPGNFDDDQLVAEDPVPKPEDEFTHMSIAIALRKTFPIRLAVTKFLNNVGSKGTYEETLRLDADLRETYKSLCRTLQGRKWSSGSSASKFAVRAVDFLMHRYFSCLHVPFFGQALHGTAYAYSRKVVVETSLKLWSAVNSSSSIMAAPSRGDTVTLDQDDLARLALCSSGYFRTVAIQATLLIAVELRTQLQEEESLGPVQLRPDLLSVLDGAKTWCLKCIEAGETNIRSYLLICVITAQIEGLMQGLGKEEILTQLINSAEDAEVRCLPILEDMAAHGKVDGICDELPEKSMDTPQEGIEDWDFMVGNNHP
jgi:Fungal specific transcription factor domain